MAKEVKAGMTDYSVFVFIPDPASTDGSGKTGLVAANLTVSAARMETDNDATITDYTSSLNNLAALTTAHTDWGILEVSSTLAPGLYRLDIADAIFASGAWSAVVYVMITSSAAAASPIEFILIPQAPIDGVLLAPTTHTSAVIPTVTTTTTATNVTTVNGLAAGVITAASIAADAITDAKVASDVTIASVTGAVGSVTGNVGGNVTGSVGSVVGAVGSVTGAVGSVTAAITLPTIPTAWITADGIATDAIGSAELAASAITEIQAGLSTLDAAGIRTAVGLASANLDTQLSTIDTVVDSILVDTAEIGAAGAGLTALATQASVNTIAGYIDTEIATLTTLVNDVPTNAELATALASADDAVLAAIAALNNLSAAQVNAQVLDCLAVDTYAEPAQGAPAATATLAAKINYIYKAWRNKKTQTATTFSLFADDGTTVDQKATTSDDGTTTTVGEVASGP